MPSCWIRNRLKGFSFKLQTSCALLVRLSLPFPWPVHQLLCCTIPVVWFLCFVASHQESWSRKTSYLRPYLCLQKTLENSDCWNTKKQTPVTARASLAFTWHRRCFYRQVSCRKEENGTCVRKILQCNTKHSWTVSRTESQKGQIIPMRMSLWRTFPWRSRSTGFSAGTELPSYAGMYGILSILSLRQVRLKSSGPGICWRQRIKFGSSREHPVACSTKPRWLTI